MFDVCVVAFLSAAILYVLLFYCKWNFEGLAPVSIKSTNRQFRFDGNTVFGYAGHAGKLSGAIDRTLFD